MRKYLALLALGALALGVTQAFADLTSSVPRLVNEGVAFRRSRNDATLGLTAQQISNGYVDSVTVTSQGKGVIVTSTGGSADTTAPISLVGAVTHGNFFTGADTTAWLRFTVIPGADCAAASVVDSLYIIPQVSVGGGLWEFVQLQKDIVTGGVPFTAASILTQSFPMLRMTNAGVGSLLFHSCISSRFTPDVCNMYSFPQLRFIVLHDISASATAAKHQYSAAVSYWSTK